MEFVDFTFGIHPKAFAVAHLLNHLMSADSYKDLKSPRFYFYRQTSPWYNGRERGLCFSAGNISGPVLNICVFEHRSSDAICALKWESKDFGMNPPTIDKVGSEAHLTDNKCGVAHSVSYNEPYEMANWIAEEFEVFLNKLVEVKDD